MKRTSKLYALPVFAAVLLLTLPGFSKGKEKELAGPSGKSAAETRPKWLSCSFTNEDAVYFVESDKLPTEKGLFIAGFGESQLHAMQEAMFDAFFYINFELASTSVAHNPNEEITEELISGPDISSLTKIIDTYEDKNGTFYVLMFLSDENIKRIATGSFKSDWRVERITTVTGSSATEEIRYYYKK